MYRITLVLITKRPIDFLIPLFYLPLVIFLIISISISAAADEPVIIAHRGASGYLPEHTAEAKVMAYGMGADYLEQDLVLSRDNVPVVLHDIYLNAISNVSRIYPDRAREDGRYYVIDFTVAELKKLSLYERRKPGGDALSYGDRFPAAGGDFRMLTLAEELELILGLNKSTGREVGVYPEIKFPAWHRREGKDISKIVLDVLKRYGYSEKEDKAYLQCFNEKELRRIRHGLGSRLKLVQLIGDEDWGYPHADFAFMQTEKGLKYVSGYADGIAPAMKHIIPGLNKDKEPNITMLVDHAHRLGLVVHPYTFRSDRLPSYADSFQTLLHLFLVQARVDGLFTDFPDMAVSFRDNLHGQTGRR